MKLFLCATVSILWAASAAFAQVIATNPIPQIGSQGVLQPVNGQNQPQPQNAAAPPPPLPPPTPQASTDKPNVIITAQGTVLNEDQKRLVSQKLQEIPGVVVITNRIHVVGINEVPINEAAGAAVTNGAHGRNRVNGANPTNGLNGANGTNGVKTRRPPTFRNAQ